ncbi:MAG: hypothetical protein AAF514_22355 [Verrucomicrobiota bacterium]
MNFRPKLLQWLVSAVWIPNQIAIWIACLFSLGVPKPLYEYWIGIIFFASIHAFLTTAFTHWVGPYRVPIPFLYSRGYDRNTLWSHHLLASIVSALHVLIPVGLFLLTGFRGKLQNYLGNPLYPMMEGRDLVVLPLLALTYALAFSFAHYVWIRHRQPTRGPWSGLWLLAPFPFALAALGDLGGHRILDGGLAPATAAGVILILVATLSFGSFRLHQTLEIR